MDSLRSSRSLAAAAAQSLPAEWRQQCTLARTNVLLLQRKYEEALRIAETLNEDVTGDHIDEFSFKYYAIGAARKGLHDETGARDAFVKARAFAEKHVAEAPQDAARHAILGPILALLGERDAALAAAQKATQLQPESRDAFEGPNMTEALAQTHAILGDADTAVTILDGLLSRPSPVTVQELKLNPLWDPVRQDPRFIAMLKKHGG